MSEKIACDVTKPNCNIPSCVNDQKCGSISWFGNLTTCMVVLQYKLPDEGEWRSLGMYKPGEHLDLGDAALWLPSQARVRILQIPNHGKDLQHPKLIAEFGEIGLGLSDIYVDQNLCQESPEILPGSSSYTAESSCPPRTCPTRPSCVFPLSIRIWTFLVLLVLLFTLVVAYKLILLCK